MNPANHKPGIPLDMISYHCYASANSGQKFEDYEYAVFDKAENFINAVRFVENIKKRLSPNTKTDINELGTFVSEEMRTQPIPARYWNLSASVYAYFFIELTKNGIDVIGESQLVGFPTQFPDVSMINYINNKPNARFWVLKLIKDQIKAGSKLVNTSIDHNKGDDLLAQGFKDADGKSILLLNKRSKALRVTLPAELKGAQVAIVDEASGDDQPVYVSLNKNYIDLKPYAVALIKTAY